MLVYWRVKAVFLFGFQDALDRWLLHLKFPSCSLLWHQNQGLYFGRAKSANGAFKKDHAPDRTYHHRITCSIMPQNMISYLKTESLLMILLDKSPKPTRNKTPKVTAGAANPPQEQMNQTCNCKESISTLRSVSISQKAFYVFRNAYTCSIPSSDSVNWIHGSGCI